MGGRPSKECFEFLSKYLIKVLQRTLNTFFCLNITTSFSHHLLTFQANEIRVHLLFIQMFLTFWVRHLIVFISNIIFNYL